MTKKCECEVCGSDLYSEKNIKAEIKLMQDKLYEVVSTKSVGRPTFVIVVGDNGGAFCSSSEFKGGCDDGKELLLLSLSRFVQNIIRTPAGDL